MFVTLLFEFFNAVMFIFLFNLSSKYASADDLVSPPFHVIIGIPLAHPCHLMPHDLSVLPTTHPCLCSELLMLPRAKRGRSAECLHTTR